MSGGLQRGQRHYRAQAARMQSLLLDGAGEAGEAGW